MKTNLKMKILSFVFLFLLLTLISIFDIWSRTRSSSSPTKTTGRAMEDSPTQTSGRLVIQEESYKVKPMNGNFTFIDRSE